MQLYYVELRVLLYRILHVDLARSRSRSSIVYGTVLGVPYVAYWYSRKVVWRTVPVPGVAALISCSCVTSVLACLTLSQESVGGFYSNKLQECGGVPL